MIYEPRKPTRPHTMPIGVFLEPLGTHESNPFPPPNQHSKVECLYCGQLRSPAETCLGCGAGLPGFDDRVFTTKVEKSEDGRYIRMKGTVRDRKSGGPLPPGGYHLVGEEGREEFIFGIVGASEVGRTTILGF